MLAAWAEQKKLWNGGADLSHNMTVNRVRASALLTSIVSKCFKGEHTGPSVGPRGGHRGAVGSVT